MKKKDSNNTMHSPSCNSIRCRTPAWRMMSVQPIPGHLHSSRCGCRRPRRRPDPPRVQAPKASPDAPSQKETCQRCIGSLYLFSTKTAFRFVRVMWVRSVCLSDVSPDSTTWTECRVSVLPGLPVDTKVNTFILKPFYSNLRLPTQCRIMAQYRNSPSVAR